MEYLFRIIDTARKTKRQKNDNKKATSTLEINTKNALKTKNTASIDALAALN